MNQREPDDRVRSRSAGFTLVEMLVVIAIIMILASTAGIFFLRFTQSRGLRSAASEFESVVSQARRAASNTRQPHYLVFERRTEEKNARMVILRDLDPDDGPDPKSDDRLVGQHGMQGFVEFALNGDPGAGPTVDNGSSPWWIKFAGDGSIYDASGSDDPFTDNRSMSEVGSPEPTLSNNIHDFLITRQSGDMVFIDWEPLIGKVVAKVYASQ